VPVQAVGARRYQGRLAVGRQRLVCAGDQRVGAERDRVPGQRRVETEVRTPGLVHHDRHAGRVRGGHQRPTGGLFVSGNG
jgi:hypothetical protein